MSDHFKHQWMKIKIQSCNESKVMTNFVSAKKKHVGWSSGSTHQMMIEMWAWHSKIYADECELAGAEFKHIATP